MRQHNASRAVTQQASASLNSNGKFCSNYQPKGLLLKTSPWHFETGSVCRRSASDIIVLINGNHADSVVVEIIYMTAPFHSGDLVDFVVDCRTEVFRFFRPRLRNVRSTASPRIWRNVLISNKTIGHRRS
jgi:hypothetical protein